MRNGLVYRKKDSGILFYIPKSMEFTILHKYHDEMGHYSVEKTVNNIMRNYWFPKLRTKVEIYIKNCLKCIAFSPVSGRKEGLLNSIPKGEIPFHTLHIDFLGPLDKKCQSKQHVLLVIDAFTKYVKLYATKTTASKEAIRYLTDYFQNYSIPRIIISDRGTAFTSQEFRDFLDAKGVQHIAIATGSPQANGQVERINRTLTPMIAKLMDMDDKKQWYTVLPRAEFSINNTTNRSTGDIPSRLLFGVAQRGNIEDAVANFLQEKNNDQVRDLETIRSKASEKIISSQRLGKEQANRKRKEAHQYKSGDLVMIKNFDCTPGASKKLIPKFKGPYVISKILRNNRYIITDINGFQQTNKPYKGTWEACNMKPWRDNS